MDDTKKMRNAQIRMLFALLAALVAIVTLVMHMRIGSVGHRFLLEMMTFDWAGPQAHPKSGMGSSVRLFTSNENRRSEFDYVDSLALNWSKRQHQHSHDHNDEVRFVLRESNLGAPSFVGRNILDLDGENNVYGRQNRGNSIIDELGNITIPKWKPIPTAENSVAIGLAITTRRQAKLTADNMAADMPFFKSLVTSFCFTASNGYDYHFYVGHDHNDPFFHTFKYSHSVFEMVFYSIVNKHCPKTFNVTLHLVECGHTGRPAWAQNDAMMAAYMDNAEYYYRVNDDTIMETSGWTEKFVEELDRFSPPKVGVIGPWFKEGNYHILTHDFVHRSHVDIFGFYYPRIFTDWFADDWITGVYYPERCRKVHGTKVKHTMEQGSRYVVHFEKVGKVAVEVEIGKAVLNRWLQRHSKTKQISANMTSKFVISMALASDASIDKLYGALRYSQLVPIVLPQWRVRIYTKEPSTGKMPRSHLIMMKKLESAGVEVVKLDKSIEISPLLWPFLVADDVLRVDKFLIRKSDSRPSEREALLIQDWVRSNSPWHCIRDHPRHARVALVPSLIGGSTSSLQKLFNSSWSSLMVGYELSGKFLHEVVWPRVKGHSYCHDSVSCTKWPGAAPFPILRKENEYVGQQFDANDEPLDEDNSILWNSSFISPDCVFLKNTGFREESVRAVIQHRPVFWSQDYHVTPIMDIKSLLNPIGVKVIDKSLSGYCHSVGTCALDLKVINQENGMKLTSYRIEQFYHAYRNDSEMKLVTTFVCTLPISMCEAFVPFNKSMLIIATLRYEQNHWQKQDWLKFNEFLRNVSRDARSVIAANNLYDAKYMEYFTGIKPIVLPNYCGYINDTYKPKSKHFLVTPIHSSPLYDKFFADFDNVIMKRQLDLTIFPLREMYHQYLFSDLASHPGIIYIPYQVSMISMTEHYRINIPLFVPSIDLLAKWHVQYQVVRQRTWEGFFQRKGNGSVIEGVLPNTPDPNDDLDEEAVRYWLQFADYYRWPHIIYFESMEDLVEKLLHVDLQEISNRMKQYNEKLRQTIKDTWSDVLLKLSTGKPISQPALRTDRQPSL